MANLTLRAEHTLTLTHTHRLALKMSHSGKTLWTGLVFQTWSESFLHGLNSFNALDGRSTHGEFFPFKFNRINISLRYSFMCTGFRCPSLWLLSCSPSLSTLHWTEYLTTPQVGFLDDYYWRKEILRSFSSRICGQIMRQWLPGHRCAKGPITPTTYTLHFTTHTRPKAPDRTYIRARNTDFIGV